MRLVYLLGLLKASQITVICGNSIPPRVGDVCQPDDKIFITSSVFDSQCTNIYVNEGHVWPYSVFDSPNGTELTLIVGRAGDHFLCRKRPKVGTGSSYLHARDEPVDRLQCHLLTGGIIHAIIGSSTNRNTGQGTPEAVVVS